MLVDGKDVFAMKDRELTIFRRRNIGFIFQAFNLIPELTVDCLLYKSPLYLNRISAICVVKGILYKIVHSFLHPVTVAPKMCIRDRCWI